MKLTEAIRISKQIGQPLSNNKRQWISDKRVLEAIRLIREYESVRKELGLSLAE
jgi:hypothetical protein